MHVDNTHPKFSQQRYYHLWLQRSGKTWIVYTNYIHISFCRKYCSWNFKLLLFFSMTWTLVCQWLTIVSKVLELLDIYLIKSEPMVALSLLVWLMWYLFWYQLSYKLCSVYLVRGTKWCILLLSCFLAGRWEEWELDLINGAPRSHYITILVPTLRVSS